MLRTGTTLVDCFGKEFHICYQKTKLVERKYNRKLLVSTGILFVISFLVVLCILLNALTSLHQSVPENAAQPHVSPSYQIPRTSTLSPLHNLQNSALLQEFCNKDRRPVVGLEGFVPKGYQLLQVHIVLSPGIDAPIPLNFTPSLQDQNDPEVVEFHQEVENLQQKPLHYLQKGKVFKSKDYYHSVKKSVALGNHFNKIYIRKWKLETSQIRPKHFLLSSDHQRRPLLSLLATLFTFTTRKLFRNVEVSFHNHSRLKEGMEEGEIHLKSLHSRHISNAIRNQTQVQQLMQKIGQHLTTGNTLHIDQMFDILLSNLCFIDNRPCLSLPCSQTSSPEKNLLNSFSLVIKEFLSNLERDKAYLHNTDIHAFPYMNTLISRLHRGENIFQKIFVHSADHRFIFYLLSTLRFHLTSLPPLGSRVVFELYKSTSKRHDYFIKVLYNGQDISPFIPLCKLRSKSELCKLKYFVDYHVLKHKSLKSKGYL